MPADVPVLLPADAANRELLAHVHPPGWVNPTPKARYHLVVIGAGTGGLVTAAAAAGLGARVALVERHLMGGDCLNVGCVPSKAVISAARAWDTARRAAHSFHGPRAEGDGDFAAAMERMRRLRARIAPVDGAPRFRDLGVDVFLGSARFTSPETVEVGGATLRFRKAVIATGARAAAPPVPGLVRGPYLTNETVFSLTERPQHLIVLGGGPIGCEMAQSFARFGARVTLLNRDPRLLPRDDADAGPIIERALTRDGVRVMNGAEVLRVTWDERTPIVTVRAGGAEEALAGSHLLVAAGRAPNVDGLGLDRAGVTYTARGVTVNDHLRTTNSRIYAVGDVCSPLQFTHLADFHARLVVQNSLFLGRARASRLVVPWCTYTSPEVAHVGVGPDELATMAAELDTVTVPLDEMDRAILEGETEGYLKVHLRKGTPRIVAATLVAPHAGETIGELAAAITNNLGLDALGRTIHPYPTVGEIIRKAADQWRRRKLTPTAKRALRWWFSRP